MTEKNHTPRSVEVASLVNSDPKPIDVAELRKTKKWKIMEELLVVDIPIINAFEDIIRRVDKMSSAADKSNEGTEQMPKGAFEMADNASKTFFSYALAERAKFSSLILELGEINLDEWKAFLVASGIYKDEYVGTEPQQTIFIGEDISEVELKQVKMQKIFDISDRMHRDLLQAGLWISAAPTNPSFDDERAKIEELFTRIDLERRGYAAAALHAAGITDAEWNNFLQMEADSYKKDADIDADEVFEHIDQIGEVEKRFEEMTDAELSALYWRKNEELVQLGKYRLAGDYMFAEGASERVANDIKKILEILKSRGLANPLPRDIK